MVKTLKQIGNSYGVIIDKPILEILHITPETPLENHGPMDKASRMPSCVRPRKRPARKRDALRWTRYGDVSACTAFRSSTHAPPPARGGRNKRHASTLKKLAK